MLYSLTEDACFLIIYQEEYQCYIFNVALNREACSNNFVCCVLEFAGDNSVVLILKNASPMCAKVLKYVNFFKNLSSLVIDSKVSLFIPF